MVSLLLCHECFTWVLPQYGRCPDCQAAVDRLHPDPSPEDLRNILGDLTLRLGEVQVRRKHLPPVGLLYATTRGLYFVPHTLEEVTEFVEEEAGDGTLLWSLAGMVWTPLSLFSLLYRSTKLTEQQKDVYRPQLLNSRHSDRLPSLLMDNPGTFFIPRRAIQHVEQRWRGWIVRRLNASPVRFRPLAGRRFFNERMVELLDTAPEWQHVRQ